MLRKPGQDNILLLAESENDANLYYATHFLVPDPIIYLEIDGQKILLVGDLEYGRARDQAEVDLVLSTRSYEEELLARGERLKPVPLLHMYLTERGVNELVVPTDFPLGHARSLEKLGYRLTCRDDPFFPERTSKTEEEVRAIQRSQEAAEECMAFIVEEIRKSDIQGDKLYRGGEPLTAEWLRTEGHKLLLESGFEASHTIIAAGDQGCDPHNNGSGHLPANQTIVIDIFPRSSRTRYWGDLTRTVLRGKASPRQRKLHEDVLEAQTRAIKSLRAGANGKDVHRGVVDFFAERGNSGEEKNGRRTGFFHSTGHGVGLDLHEEPRLGRVDWKLEAGHVVTVEPGLYYPGLGAVRIEDILVVTDDGSRNLTRFPKEFEV